MFPSSHSWSHLFRKEIARHRYLPALMLTLVGAGIFANLYQYPPSYADEGMNGPRKIIGTFGTAHTLGTFLSSGNAGQVAFPTGGIGGISLNPANNRFTGYAWSETVGWIEFGAHGQNITMTPPLLGKNTLDPWKLSGYAWSENAGWIAMESLAPASYSGVSYLPVEKSFTGFAWSDTLGYIDFGNTTGLADGFIGKVKSVCNVTGEKIYDAGITNYTALSSTIQIKNAHTDFMNTRRKEIASLVRNLQPNHINTVSSDDKEINTIKYYRVSNSFIQPRFTTTVQSIIVEGSDIFIDTDIPASPLSDPRTIIAMKDAHGNGGNIYIHGSVKNINVSLIAEGTIYSGKRATAPATGWDLYNDTKDEVTNLPTNQLYIKGIVVSRNTIGGSTKSGTEMCPYGTPICNRDTALKYDMNYFRSYTSGDIPRRAYPNSSLDSYSLILECDPRLIKSQPQGLKMGK